MTDKYSIDIHFGRGVSTGNQLIYRVSKLFDSD